MKPETVAIVGLGLMGGSLALALKETGAAERIIGVDADPAALEAAQARGAIDAASSELGAVRAAGLVVLATPVRAILRLLPAIGAQAADGALVLDLGSTKRAIVGAMNHLPARVSAVGGHPMCGKETSGFQVAEAGLFRDKTFVLTPCARTSPAALAQAQALAQAIGARPVILDAARHDRLAAAASHLPFLVASNLMSCVMQAAGKDELMWQLAASGFRDTTRLAASDTQMMLDIIATNRENIVELLRDCASGLEGLAALIEDEAEEVLSARMEAAAAARREWGRHV